MGRRTIEKILVPIELSETTKVDADYAIGLAEQLGAELILVSVVDSAAATTIIASGRRAEHGSRASFNEILVKDAEQILRNVVDDASTRGVKAWGHAKVSEHVEEQILNEAIMHKVDLILVRSHGRSGLSKALLGSTAGDILKAAPCPVLVAREGRSRSWHG